MGPAMPDAITSQEVLDQQLADTRRRGYATDFEEHFAGVCCVAAPIRDFSGCVVASVSIAAPTQRMPLTQVAQLGEDVRAAASEISRRLGGAMAPEREVVGAPAGR
jgi:IclR family acetate operon transcriptional repressor